MANPDSTSINEIEKARWMIGRIDQLQKSLIDGLESSATKYESEGSKGISELKEWRAKVCQLL